MMQKSGCVVIVAWRITDDLSDVTNVTPFSPRQHCHWIEEPQLIRVLLALLPDQHRVCQASSLASIFQFALADIQPITHDGQWF